ncbi:DNA-binding transcriptional regulator LysR [Sodalis glossinidius str. 'morsitans']|uniref:DNA-binding transcriptional regulator LysR n=1 Tax=Sodalis glossinidius (strain morsitans) TaxID=343509 RepID=A0A193QME5_SODGM|nr:LysR family transcriptional regulator [Sodalis glossinidius]CRL46100.1 DNA-binding transcriptional regulator LysR [Sodalis glossinidius str. 'morsitans']
MLAHAEQQLGFALFDRLPSSLQPTPRAQRLMPEIEQLYLHLQRIDQLAQRLREPQPQQLRIGAVHAMGQVFMAQVLMDYRRLAPPLSAEVELVTGHQDTLCQDLLAERLDLVLAFGQSVAPGLTAEVPYRADMVLAGGGVGIVDTFTASRYAAQLQVVAIQEALPFEVQWLTTASQAAEPAVLLMRSIISRQREPWRDALHCARTRDVRAGWWQPSRGM